MSTATKIEWCDATWNPVRGCSRVSEGCRNCYAERVAARFAAKGGPFEGFVKIGKAQWTGRVELVEKHLLDPLRWRKPRKIFVNSMSDLLHEALPLVTIERVFRTMLSAPRHTYQILTKRADRMPEVVTTVMNRIFGPHWAMPDFLWLGVSVEDRARKDRVERLRETPAAIRFLSIEPLLEDIGDLDLRGIDWVICGGESGPGARPMHPEWVRGVRGQCVDAGVPFFFKQWGEWLPGEQDGAVVGGEQVLNCADDPVRVGKKAAGRLLDGREWNEFPAPRIGASA